MQVTVSGMVPKDNKMQILVNGENREVEAQTVAALLALLGVDVMQVAVELNQAMVPKSAYDTTTLGAGDAIEIVEFIGGG